MTPESSQRHAPTDILHFDLAQGFSHLLGPRREELGPFSAEEFYEKFMHPWLESKQRVVIRFDGVKRWSYSFVDGVFGQAVLDFGIELVRELITLSATTPLAVEWRNEAELDMQRAEAKRIEDAQ